MSAYLALLPAWEDWAAAVLFACHLVTVHISLALPWLAAHLEHWGRRSGRADDLESASRLSLIAAANLGGLFLFGVASLLIVSVRRAEAFFPAAILMAPVLAVLLLLLAGHVGLIHLYRFGWAWSERRPGLHLAAGMGAGLLALPLPLVFAALSLSAASPSGWARLGEDPWGSLLAPAALYRALLVWVSSFVTGGVVLMLTGRPAFRWKGGAPVSEGARRIRLGALFSLWAMILALVMGAWLLRGWFVAGAGGPFALRRDMLLLLVLAAAGAVALLEVLVIALRRRGSAPAMGAAAAALLFCVLLSVVAVRAMVSGRPQALFSSVKTSQLAGRAESPKPPPPPR